MFKDVYCFKYEQKQVDEITYVKGLFKLKSTFFFNFQITIRTPVYVTLQLPNVIAWHVMVLLLLYYNDYLKLLLQG